MRLVVALIVTLALVSTASADNYVWFTSSDAAVTTQGSPGVSLAFGQGGTYGIDVYASATASVTAYYVALGAAPGASGAGLQGVFVPASWAAMASNMVGVSPVLAAGAFGGYGITGALNTGLPVMHFTLTIADNTGLIGGNDDNSPGWGDSVSGDFVPVWFGAFLAPDSVPGTWAPGEAIHAFPEPATLALLGLGLVGLLRRR